MFAREKRPPQRLSTALAVLAALAVLMVLPVFAWQAVRAELMPLAGLTVSQI